MHFHVPFWSCVCFIINFSVVGECPKLRSKDLKKSNKTFINNHHLYFYSKLSTNRKKFNCNKRKKLNWARGRQMSIKIRRAAWLNTDNALKCTFFHAHRPQNNENVEQTLLLLARLHAHFPNWTFLKLFTVVCVPDFCIALAMKFIWILASLFAEKVDNESLQSGVLCAVQEFRTYFHCEP